ncbi:MAG TPA: hypothetical protein VE177_07335 [Candidatus Binatus sp.]|nr:hypothetical protein [Candidatus Binatus sp.]
MRHRTPQIVLILTLVIVSIPIWFQPVQASETLAINPIRGQEQNTPGSTLTMTVTGAITGQSYTYYWAVVDPYGNNTNVASTTTAPSTTFTLTEVYPRDFGVNAAVRFVGRYRVAVFQALGANSYRFATAGAFDIGLTNKLFYQRTEPVSIKAYGYNSSDNVNVNITRARIPVPGYPKSVIADTSGNVITSWLTTVSIPTGNYTVSLTGTTTRPKTPPDSQWFIINTATLTVTANVTSTSGNVLAISTKITTPNGASFTQGNVAGLFSTSGQPIGSSIGLSYNQSQGRWTGKYTVKSSDPTGLWAFEVTASDSHGNSGEGSASIPVTAPPPPIPPPETPMTTYWFLLAVIIAGGTILGSMAIKRKRMLPPHLQVDLKEVDAEADRVMNQDFFRSLQKQLDKKDKGESDG